jgi:hypothetical protein
MPDEFIIEILLRARDEASRQIDALQAKVDGLRASAAGGRSTQDLERGFSDVGVAAGDSADETARLRTENERLRREGPQHRSALQGIARDHNVAAEAAGGHADATSGAADETARMIDEVRRGQSAFRDQKVAVDDTAVSYERFNKAVRDGRISTSDARRGYQDFSNDFRKLSRGFETGSEDALRFGRAADEAGGKLKNIPLAQASNDFERAVARISRAGDSFGVKVISLSAELRGLRVVGIVGFIQQLDTAIVGLAGSLTAVASDAAEAGAALGGALVSGLAQAVPVAAVFLAGIERIKSVLSAVQLSTQLKQQQAFDPTQQAATQLQTAQALTAAQNGLVDAYNNVTTAQTQVKESQQALTDARTAAIRNIIDLTLAEKTASEQATGARLSLAQAENALQQLEQTGGSQLQLQQAQLAVQEARTGVTQANIAVPRAQADAALARRRGVAGSSGVMSAVEAARQARLAQTRAPQQVQAAQATLRLAQMTAASPSGSETSTQGQLNYLLGQMTAPEKVLYNALSTLEAQLRSPNSPLRRLSDAIVAPFADAVQKITSLLGNTKFMAVFDTLASAIGKGLHQVLSPKGGTNFFEQMAADATKNAPIIANIISNIESLFMSVAKAAAPALHTLLGFIQDFTHDLANTEGSVAGQKRLTAEFSLWETRLEHILEALHSFHMLLKAIGADAAPSGDTVFTSLTKSMDSATTWVQSHGPEVRKFFADAVSVLGILGGILLNLGKVMVAVFDSGAMKVFGQFINQTLIPAIGDVATVVGFLVTQLLALFNLIPGGRMILEGLTAAFVGMLVMNKVADAFLGATRAVQGLWGALKVFQATGSITAAFKTFADHMNGVRDSAHQATGEVTDLGDAQQIAADKTVKGTVLQDEATGIQAVGDRSKVAAPEVVAVGDAEAGMGDKAIASSVLTGEATGIRAMGAAGAAAALELAPYLLAMAATAAAVLAINKLLGKAPPNVNTGPGSLPAPGYSGPAALAGLNIFPTTGESLKSVENTVAGQGYTQAQINHIDAMLKGGSFFPGGKYQPVPASKAAQSAVSQSQKNLAINTSASSPSGFARAFLQQIGAPVTPASMSALNAWWNAEEGGHVLQPGHGGANNPFEIVGGYGVPTTGAANSVGVSNFATPQQGIQAAINYFKAQSGISNVIGAFQQPGATTASIEAAVRGLGPNAFGSDTNAAWGGGSPSTSTQASTAPSSTGGGGGTGAGAGAPAAPKTPSGPPMPKGLPSSVASGLSAFGQKIFNAIPGVGVPNTLAFIGADPANAIQMISTAFTSVISGLNQLRSVGEKLQPLSRKISDFTNFASNFMNDTWGQITQFLAQLTTRLTDAGILAGFTSGTQGMSFGQIDRRPAGVGDVISAGVGAGDQAVIGGLQEERAGLQGQQSIATRMIAGIVAQRKKSKLITNAKKRAAALAGLNTQYALWEAASTALGDQIATNIQATYQAEQQVVTDELQQVSNVYGTQLAGLTAQQGGAQALGRFDLLPAIDQAMAVSAANQVTALQDALQKASAMGDATTVSTIQQQIDQLNQSIVQYTAQALQDAISGVQQAAQTTSSGASLFAGLASVATTQGNFGLAGALANRGFQTSISGDQSQIASYAGSGANLQAIAGGDFSSVSASSLLGMAIVAGNTGAQATIIQALDGIGTDLATNTQALADNTASTDNAASAYVQSRGQFQSGVYGGLAQIIQTIGQTTGSTDVGTLMQAYQGSNNSLNIANAGLAGTLNSDFGVNVQGLSPGDLISKLMGLNLSGMEAGMDPAQAAEFENLINSLITNTQAITQNNLQLATLNGQLTQPQSFASSLWTNFRDAIFTGMGGLQPAYASSLGIAAATNPAFTGTGIANSSTTTHINVSTNPVSPEVNPYTQGKQIAFSMKTPV